MGLRSWFKNLILTDSDRAILFGLQKRAALGNPSISLSDPRIWDEIFGIGGKTAAGVNVSEESSLGLSGVWASARILGQSLGSLPLQVFRRTDIGKEIVRDHPVYNLLHSIPWPNYTSYVWRQTMQIHLTLWGNAYSIIHRNTFQRPVGFEIVHPSKVTPKLTEDGMIIYEITDRGIFRSDNILHCKWLTLDGLIGKSPVQIARETVGTGLAEQTFQGKFYGKGAISKGVIQFPEWISPKARENFKADFEKKTEGPDNTGGTMYLEDGVKYQSLSIPQSDAQFIESRKFSVDEIARIFGIPPHMLAELSKSSFNNIEQQSIEFAVHSVRPHLVNWEQELNRKVFSEEEKEEGLLFTEFNLDGFLRGDVQARSEYYAKLWGIGVLSQNQILSLENFNAIGPEGDRKYVPMNMIPTDKVDQQINNGNNTQTGDND